MLYKNLQILIKNRRCVKGKCEKAYVITVIILNILIKLNDIAET